MTEKKQLTIMQMNDTHGYYQLHNEMFIEKGTEVYRKVLGCGIIATILEEVRAEIPGRVFALDNGDTFHGTYPVVETTGEGLLPILNKLAFDAMPAHWEFAYVPQHAETL